jgi:hypothetical protein
VQKVRALAPEYGSPRLVSLLQAEEEKLEKTAREFRQQELAAAVSRMNSGVIEEEVAMEGAGSIATAMMNAAIDDSAAVVEDGVYQAVFQRMVDGKLPEPGSLETQSPFSKLLKCYYDTGRITKWEDVRELDIPFILLAVAIVLTVVCYVHSRRAEAQRQQELLPRLAADSMVKGLRQYQRETGQFPADFAELEQRVWKHANVPDFGPAKRTLTVANYYHMDSKVDPLTCVVWAIPSGPRREEGSTHFLVIGPEVIRRWKEPALSKAHIDKLEPVPTADVLNIMGMTEQSMIDQRSAGSRSGPTPQVSMPVSSVKK